VPTTTPTTTHRPGTAPVPASTRTPLRRPTVLSVLGALLALAVSAIHVVDQGGIPGSKTPTYVGVGYWVLEVAGVLVAAVLLTRPRWRPGWVLAAGVALGPLVGYCLSRGPGLPAYTDDRGNWTEPLGLLSLVVEATLLLVSVTGLRRADLEQAAA
jgi:hypothetical protein